MRSKSKNRAEVIFAILAKTSTQFIGFHMSEYGHGSIPKSFNSPSFWPMFTHFCFVHTNNPENTRSFKVANKIYLIASWSSPYYGNSLFSLKVGIIFERLSYPVGEEKIYHMTLHSVCRGCLIHSWTPTNYLLLQTDVEYTTAGRITGSSIVCTESLASHSGAPLPTDCKHLYSKYPGSNTPWKFISKHSKHQPWK